MFIGMDCAAVRALAQLLKQIAAEIMEIISQISSQLGSCEWVGQDRTQFESDWEGQYKTALTNISQALEAFAQVAEKNAAEQEATSAA